MNVRKCISNAIHICCIVLFSIFFYGCEKAPVNSDVEGFWKLNRFTINETGEVVECSRLYYGITHMVTEVSEKQGSNNYGSYIGRTEYRDNGNQLVIKDLKVRAFTSDNKTDAPVDKLKHFGINSQEETVFDIVKCDGEFMILKSDYAEIELEKF